MKKLMIMATAALLLAGCSADKYEDWAAPQSSQEETSKTASFDVANVAATIDFANVTTDSVQLFVPTLNTQDPVKAQKLKATLFNATKTANYVLNTDEKGFVKASELQAAVETLYGKAGKLRTISGTVANNVTLERGEGFTFSKDFTVNAQLVKPNFNEFIYEIGGDSEWKVSQPLRSEEFDGNYVGYCYLNGEFKFRSDANEWKGPDWEYGGTEGALSENGTGNIANPGEGFYRVEASLADGTYKLTKLETIGIVGDAVGDWNVDKVMTFNKADKCWEWTGDMVPGEYKFRANSDWTYSWGGPLDNLSEHNGANLKMEEAGKYTIKLYITYEGNNKVEVKKN